MSANFRTISLVHGEVAERKFGPSSLYGFAENVKPVYHDYKQLLALHMLMKSYKRRMGTRTTIKPPLMTGDDINTGAGIMKVNLDEYFNRKTTVPNSNEFTLFIIHDYAYSCKCRND